MRAWSLTRPSQTLDLLHLQPRRHCAHGLCRPVRGGAPRGQCAAARQPSQTRCNAVTPFRWHVPRHTRNGNSRPAAFQTLALGSSNRLQQWAASAPAHLLRAARLPVPRAPPHLAPRARPFLRNGPCARGAAPPGRVRRRMHPGRARRAAGPRRALAAAFLDPRAASVPLRPPPSFPGPGAPWACARGAVLSHQVLLSP